MALAPVEALILYRINDPRVPEKEGCNPYEPVGGDNNWKYDSFVLSAGSTVMLLQHKKAPGLWMRQKAVFMQLLAADFVGWLYVRRKVWLAMVQAFESSSRTEHE